MTAPLPRIIHRIACGVRGLRPACDPTSDRFAFVSTSGFGVTCPHCERLAAPPQPAELMKKIRAAAERYRNSKEPTP